MFVFLVYLLIFIFVLVSVGFITLLERSVLGFIQLRSGPNKTGNMGFIQPISDAGKLFSSGWVFGGEFNLGLYLITPPTMLFIMMIMWVLYPMMWGGFDFNYGLLYYMCGLGVGVYIILGCGWASNSKFSMIGAIRGVAQSISYEVSLGAIILCVSVLVNSYNLKLLFGCQEYIFLGYTMFPLMLTWFSVLLAETNRTPFDFSEGESELVSGFNVEYSGVVFALLFMGEYGMIIFSCIMMSVLFFALGWLFFFFFMVFIFSFLWVRGTMPRHRYDKLMYLAWKSYLPISLHYLLFSVGLLVFVN